MTEKPAHNSGFKELAIPSSQRLLKRFVSQQRDVVVMY